MVYLSLGRSDTMMRRGAEPTSYRRLVTRNLEGTLEWWRLGIDMLFGLPTDHICDARERMFLPEEMEAELESGERRVESGERMVDQARVLLAENREPLKSSFPPVVVFAMLLLLVALLTWKRLWHAWMDRTFFVLAGVVGLFLLFMWFGTDHYCTQWNLNILWASPLLLLIAIRLECSPRWALWLQEGCFLAAVVWVVWCGLSLALIPLILTLALRVGVMLKN